MARSDSTSAITTDPSDRRRAVCSSTSRAHMLSVCTPAARSSSAYSSSLSLVLRTFVRGVDMARSSIENDGVEGPRRERVRLGRLGVGKPCG